MVPELNSKSVKEEAKGLVIIGVTDEEPNLVDQWVRRRKPTYPIVILKNKDFEKALDVKGFPTQGVIDPKGVLTYAGFSAGSEVSKALATATKGPLWPKSLEKASTLVKAGEYAKGYAELKKLGTGELDDKEKKALDKFVAHVEAVGAGALKSAQALYKDGQVLAALQTIEPFAKAEPALPMTADAKTLLAELEALPNYKLEIQGGELFDQAEGLEEEYEFLDAVVAYKAVIKKVPGTKIAGAAEKRVKDLVDRGMPGFSKSCQKCSAGKRACEKHAKAVKL